MSLYRVLYCSRNRIALEGPLEGDAMTAHIQQILGAARRNNARRGITGGLMFSNGCFAQILEGPTEAVESVFERIQLDDRHDDVTVLEAGPTTRRDFPEWAMAYSGPANHPLAAATHGAALKAQTESANKVLFLLRSVVSAHDRLAAI